MGLGFIIKQIEARRFMSPIRVDTFKRTSIATAAKATVKQSGDPAELKHLLALIHDDHLELPPADATAKVFALFTNRAR